MDIITAKVAPVPFGGLTIEGLLLENGKFAVALQQVAFLFQLLPNSVQKVIQDKLGKGCSFYRIKTNRELVEGKRVRSAENAISLLDFERLLRALDKATLRCSSNRIVCCLSAIVKGYNRVRFPVALCQFH